MGYLNVNILYLPNLTLPPLIICNLNAKRYGSGLSISLTFKAPVLI